MRQERKQDYDKGLHKFPLCKGRQGAVELDFSLPPLPLLTKEGNVGRGERIWSPGPAPLPLRPAGSLPGHHGLFLPIRSALAGFKSSRIR